MADIGISRVTLAGGGRVVEGCKSWGEIVIRIATAAGFVMTTP